MFMRIFFKILQKILLVSTVVIITGHQLYSHSHNDKVEQTSTKTDLLDIFLKVLKENHSNTYLEEYIIDQDNSQLFKVFIIPKTSFLKQINTPLITINNSNTLPLFQNRVNSIFGRAPPIL